MTLAFLEMRDGIIQPPRLDVNPGIGKARVVEDGIELRGQAGARGEVTLRSRRTGGLTLSRTTARNEPAITVQVAVRVLRQEKDRTVLEVGSGTYSFQPKAARSPWCKELRPICG